ncbi:HAD-IB family hydrolase [Phenylobacterium sp.]|uniref:HAD-IB family hydrolase n=1 Tax=Phenylobacterium sp. TaxID=1871053 RepID=UPI002C5459A7|nr:HAD-IB family hydrolase [Phenylobacterium sp.]HLZ74640.1 HAD-IB family hydrolase [Phenylobacterium sp.]
MGQDPPQIEAGPAPATAETEDRPVVAFDFDGTLTIRDSYTAFLKWRAGSQRYRAGMIRLIPAALAYLVHRDRGRIKAAATREYLRGVPRETLEADARRFAEQFSRSLLRPDAMAAWKRWRGEHVRLVIVTASPDLVVAPFARGLGADALLGTRLAFDAQGRVTGGFEGRNCRGPEKVLRLKAAFGEDFELKAAYGDTGGDREMLAAAELPGYRVFTAMP